MLTHEHERTLHFQGQVESQTRHLHRLLSDNAKLRYALKQIMKGIADPKQVAEQALKQVDGR